MAFYVICTNAVRYGNDVNVSISLMDDTPNPDEVLESYTRVFHLQHEGTNAEKRQDMRDRLVHWAIDIIDARESADANVSTIITQLIDARYPPA